MIEVMRAYEGAASLNSPRKTLCAKLSTSLADARLRRHDNARPFHCLDRHVGPADQRRSDRQQSGEHEHHRFQAAAGEFADLLYQNIQTPVRKPPTRAPMPQRHSAGRRCAHRRRLSRHHPGDLKSTGNPYDVSIQGAGFFRVQQADGADAYTRSGNFSLSPGDILVTRTDWSIQPGIAIPQNTLSVTINAQGRSQCRRRRSTARRSVSLELTRFPNEGGLNAVGSNLSGDARLRQPTSRRARFHRLRHNPAGFSGNSTSIRWTRSPP